MDVSKFAALLLNRYHNNWYAFSTKLCVITVNVLTLLITICSQIYIYFGFLLIMMVMNWQWWWWWLQKLPGYGNITPRTGLGKSMTIFYAIVGMPLFLLYLSNIGDIMAKSFKWIYAKVCLCRICPGVAKRRETRTRRKIRALERQINNEYYDENVCIHSFIIETASTLNEIFLM